MTSLKKTDKNETNVTPVEPTPPPSVSLAPLPEKPRVGGVSGEVDRTDIKRPYLQIVHSTSKSSETFGVGSIVLNGEKLLSDKGTKPVKLTVLHFKKYYQENLPFNPEGERPRMFNTLAELKAAGLHTEWIGDKKPPASAVGDALVAVESDTEDPLFPLEFNGKFYALAEWQLRSSSAYGRAGKLILTAAEFGLKAGLHHGAWELTTRREKLGANNVSVPVLKLGGKNPPELVDFFAALI